MFGRILNLGYIHFFSHHAGYLQRIESLLPRVHSNQRHPSKISFIENIPATSSNSLTSETTFSNYLLIVDVYSKVPELHGMETILMRK